MHTHKYRCTRLSAHREPLAPPPFPVCAPQLHKPMRRPHTTGVRSVCVYAYVRASLCVYVRCVCVRARAHGRLVEKLVALTSFGSTLHAWCTLDGANCMVHAAWCMQAFTGLKRLSFISSASCATRSRFAPVCATHTIIRQACSMQRAKRSATNATPAERWATCHLHASGRTKALACVCARAAKHACSCAVQYVRVDARSCAIVRVRD
jgi:hypothetical protein